MQENVHSMRDELERAGRSGNIVIQYKSYDDLIDHSASWVRDTLEFVSCQSKHEMIDVSSWHLRLLSIMLCAEIPYPTSLWYVPVLLRCAEVLSST